MYWWFYAKPTPNIAFTGGSIAYYTARWEIWDGDRLLLAGESAGKTVFPADPAAAGIWDGHGVVTYGRGHLHALKGHKIYETGPVIKPAPLYGTGIFSIY